MKSFIIVLFLALLPVAATASTTTFSNIEEKTGWYVYKDYGNPVCTPTGPNPLVVSSPSLDGAAGKFIDQPTGSYNNCLWPLKLTNSISASHFTLDVHYHMDKPAKSEALEFSFNHHVGNYWYKFSFQCSYQKGMISVWDMPNGKWYPTGVACSRQVYPNWDHLIIHAEIANGKIYWQDFTLNGVYHSLGLSFAPTYENTSSSSLGVHFQMDGDLAGDSYQTFLDQFTLTAW